jgi:hypothetical protein
MQQVRFIDNQLILNMFPTYLRPFSGGRTTFGFLSCYSCYEAGESGSEMRTHHNNYNRKP